MMQTAAELKSAGGYTLPPDTSMIIMVTCEDEELAGQFGYVAQDTREERITVPRSCTRLEAKETKIIITNFS
jgi:hypothetical protein